MRVEPGSLVFLREGGTGIGAVRTVLGSVLVVYVENSGEFLIPFTCVRTVHDRKVILDPQRLPERFIEALKHAHDREDPSIVG